MEFRVWKDHFDNVGGRVLNADAVDVVFVQTVALTEDDPAVKL